MSFIEKVATLEKNSKITIGVQKYQANKYLCGKNKYWRLVNNLTIVLIIAAITLPWFFGWKTFFVLAIILAVYPYLVTKIAAHIVRIKVVKDEGLFRNLLAIMIINIRDNKSGQIFQIDDSEAVIEAIYKEFLSDTNLENKKRTSENMFEEIYQQSFPGGDRQIQKMTEEIIRLSNRKLNENIAKSILFKAQILKSTEPFSLLRLIEGVSVDSPLNKDEMASVLAYLLYGSTDEELVKTTEIGFNLDKIGCGDDVLPDAIGEFGLNSRNPILVHGVFSVDFYQRSLVTADGRELNWERLGTSGDPIEKKIGPVDVYKVSTDDDSFSQKLYISPYNKTISKIAPKGFVFKDKKLQ